MSQSEETQFALINQKLGTIEETLHAIVTKLENHYVTQDQFKPVKAIVYGQTALILTAVIGGIIRLVVR